MRRFSIFLSLACVCLVGCATQSTNQTSVTQPVHAMQPWDTNALVFRSLFMTKIGQILTLGIGSSHPVCQCSFQPTSCRRIRTARLGLLFILWYFTRTSWPRQLPYPPGFRRTLRACRDSFGRFFRHLANTQKRPSSMTTSTPGSPAREPRQTMC